MAWSTPEIIIGNAVQGSLSEVWLTDTKKVVAYADITNSSYGTSVICDWNGSSWDIGTPNVFSSSNCSSGIATEKLDDTRFLLAYTSSFGSTLRSAEVTGLSMTYGNPYVSSSAAQYYNLDKYDDDTVLFSWNSSGYLRSRVVTVTGTYISGNIISSISSTNWTRLSTCYIGNNKFVYVSNFSGIGTDGVKAVIGTVSGATVTWGTAVQLNSDTSTYAIDVMSPEDDKFVAMYNPANIMTLNACLVSGTVITGGTEVTHPESIHYFKAGSTRWLFPVSSTEGYMLVPRSDVTELYGNLFTISGQTITFGVDEYIDDYSSTYPVTGSIGQDNNISTAYTDETNSAVYLSWNTIGDIVLNIDFVTDYAYDTETVFNNSYSIETVLDYAYDTETVLDGSYSISSVLDYEYDWNYDLNFGEYRGKQINSYSTIITNISGSTKIITSISDSSTIITGTDNNSSIL